MTNKTFKYPKYSFSSNVGHCKIAALETYFPDNEVSNEEIIQKLELQLNPKVISNSLGIATRRIADNALSDTDLMSNAAKIALKQIELIPESLDKLIVNKFFGDRMLPMTASFLQSKLQIKKAIHSFDIDGGVNAFIQSLDFIARMPMQKDSPALIASGGICNRLITKPDARHAFLFGDGASATIIQSAEKRHFLASYHLTNTEFSHLSTSMSFTNRPDIKTFEQNQDFFYDLYSMDNWSQAYDFVVEATTHSIDKMLSIENIKAEAIDGIVLGCFNKKMEQAVIEGLNWKNKTVFSSLSKYGNTMSATLPASIQEAVINGDFQTGQKLLFVSVGEGLSMGFMIYEI